MSQQTLAQRKETQTPASLPTRSAFSSRSFGEQAPDQGVGTGHSLSRVSALRPQAKLSVNQPGDKYEQEADAAADQVMRMGASESMQREGGEEDEEEKVQMKPLAGSLSPLVQREEDGAFGSADVSDVVNQGLSGGGQPLDDQTRAFMEPRFGHDFSQVRIHTDARASESAEQVAARAYTIGNDIAFGSGEYVPNSGQSRQLLAHELTHVIQQGGAKEKAPLGAIGDQAKRSPSVGGLARKVNSSFQSSEKQVQRTPHTFNPSAQATRWDPNIDMAPVIDYVSQKGTVVMSGITGDMSGNLLDNAQGNLRGVLATAPSYFLGTKAPFRTDEFVWNPGAMYAYAGIRVMIELLEDNANPLGAGTQSQVTNGASATVTTGTSNTNTTGVSGTVGVQGNAGGTTGGNGAPGTSSGAQATAGGTASSSTAIGSSGSVATGGTQQGVQASSTTVYTSNIYMKVTVTVRKWDFWSEFSNVTTTSDALSVGGARYTMPNIDVAAPAAAAPPPPP